MCMFLKAPSRTAGLESSKNLLNGPIRSYMVISEPKITANSWIEWERVLLVLLSLTEVSLWKSFLYRGQAAFPCTQMKAGKLKAA